MKRPLARDQDSVKNILFNEGDILHSEASWIQHSDDLVSVAQDLDWFNGFIEDAIAKISRSLLRVSVRFLQYQDQLDASYKFITWHLPQFAQCLIS